MIREELKEVFKVLKNVYPQFEVNSEKLDIWHKFLKEDNPAVVMRNAEIFILESKFPPTVADLREVRHPSYNNNVLDEIKEWQKNASRKQ